MLISKDASEIARIAGQGGILAYPTEAVFGLGCLADDEAALCKLLEIKKRSANKGLLLISSELSYLKDYIAPLSPADKNKILAGSIPTSWIVPAKTSISPLLTGNRESIGIRITHHLPTRELCDILKKPLVSTSANISGKEPAYQLDQLEPEILKHIDAVFDAETGGFNNPSRIIDLHSGKIIRD